MSKKAKLQHQQQQQQKTHPTCFYSTYLKQTFPRLSFMVNSQLGFTLCCQFERQLRSYLDANFRVLFCLLVCQEHSLRFIVKAKLLCVDCVTQRSQHVIGGLHHYYLATQPFFFLFFFFFANNPISPKKWGAWLWLLPFGWLYLTQGHWARILTWTNVPFSCSLIYCLQVYLSGSLPCCDSVIFWALPLIFFFVLISTIF